MTLYSKISGTQNSEFPFEELAAHPHCLIVDWREAEEDMLDAFLAATGESRDGIHLQASHTSVKVLSKGAQNIPIEGGKGVSTQHAMLLALQALYGHAHSIRYVHDLDDGDTAYFMIESPDTWQRLEQENPNIRWFFVPVQNMPDTFETPGHQLRAAAQSYDEAK